MRRKLTACLVALVTISSAPNAYADISDMNGVGVKGNTVTVKAQSQPKKQISKVQSYQPKQQYQPNNTTSGSNNSWSPGWTKAQAKKSGLSAKEQQAAPEQYVKQRQQQFKSAVAEYQQGLAAETKCLAAKAPAVGGDTSDACASPVLQWADDTLNSFIVGDPTNPAVKPTGKPGTVPVVTLTPEQAGYLAVAQLTLPLIAPGVGPDPKLNEWDMAVVGYPLWFWADGPTQLGPVAQSVGNLSVSLNAELAKVVFHLGDETTISCPGGGEEMDPRQGRTEVTDLRSQLPESVAT